MQKVCCITTFLHSINVTPESNENGRFSARLGLAKSMPGLEIENVVFLGNTEIFEERKHVVFLPLLRPTYMQILKFSEVFVIGPLHDPVTWCKITYTGDVTGDQVAQWDFQNNASAFVL